MKHIKTLSAIATAIVHWSNLVTASNMERAKLLKDADKLALPEKQKIDAELVNYYAVQAGVGVKTREKGNDGMRCMLVAAWERDAKDKAKLTPKSAAASMALSRARGILFAREKGKKAPKKGQATTPAKTRPATLEGVLAYAESRFAAGTKATGDEKKMIRKAAQMLLTLLA